MGEAKKKIHLNKKLEIKYNCKELHNIKNIRTLILLNSVVAKKVAL